MRLALRLFVIAGVAMAATAANAQNFIGPGSFMTFSNAVSPGGNFNSIANSNAIGGASVTTFSTNGDLPNVLTFTGSNGFNVAPETDFVIGNLSYFNGLTFIGAQSVDGNMNVNFTTPNLGVQSFLFNFGFTITPNNSSPLLNPLNDDILDFSFPASPNVIDVGGTIYTLAIIGFQSNGTLFTSLNLPEGQTANASIIARFTTNIPNVVPLPPAVWGGLAGMAGVGGIAAIRRRRIA